MRARILVTDGPRTRDVYWLKHTGTDVYHGAPGSHIKKSYHASGYTHTKIRDKIWRQAKVEPLEAIHGAAPLNVIGFCNPKTFLEYTDPAPALAEKVDALVIIDIRSVPEDVSVTIHIGLLEPRNWCALAEVASPKEEPPEPALETQSLTVATSVVPWVYASVTWHRSQIRPPLR